MHRTAASSLLAGWLGVSAFPGAAAVLFEAATGTGPSAQGWVYLTEPLFGAGTAVSAADGAVRLDSTGALQEKAGWFSHLPPLARHPRQPPLDAAAGFVVSFTVRVAAEDHQRPERAGFSVIVAAASLDAIELGFWTDAIWAQSGPDFLPAERAAVDTASGRLRYDLEVRGGRYRLSAEGKRVLEGQLRRYEAAGLPYTIPEFLFLGDDTSSAGARVELSRVAVSSLPRVAFRPGAEGGVVEVEAEAGRTVVVEVSSDLVSWAEAGRVEAVDGLARWPAQTAASAGRRFFRAVLE